MTQVLRSPSHFSPPSTSPLPCANDGLHPHALISSTAISSSAVEDDITLGLEEEEGKERDREGDELSLLAFLVTLLRKSWVACNNNMDREELCKMEIGLLTNVRHVAHVTFDRFNGFLGLPVEFEPEVPRRPPSASASVFGVSTESMQLSFDSRGNSVPTILLLMQNRLYAQGGLQVEGIFRINAENSQEEYVRDQLNRGVVPDGLHIHCLAGLIKAWFRELPTGVLDSLSSEQVMQSQSEEECARLARLLPPSEAALLNWAVNLMADVAQFEHVNKMNARNVAMVFAPNMTHMADPLTALMYAVQVMNFLKTLIIWTLRVRNGSITEPAPVSHGKPSDDNGHHASSQPFLMTIDEGSDENYEEQDFVVEDPTAESPLQPTIIDSTMEIRPLNDSTSDDYFMPVDKSPAPRANGIAEVTGSINCPNKLARQSIRKIGKGQSRSTLKKRCKKVNDRPFVRAIGPMEKSKGSSIVSRINSSRSEWIEAWR